MLEPPEPVKSNGSSPRRRGTPHASRLRSIWFRFIPALAGNAAGSPPAAHTFPVHPRAGGERFIAWKRGGLSTGSSPRWRGTRCPPVRDRLEDRFIPALAGNARYSAIARYVAPVHPRAGGERVGRGRMPSSHIGSSPRWRGTRDTARPLRSLDRFIPALAGNAGVRRSRWTPPSVHPRAGGERLNTADVISRFPGSSPRWRGTRLVGSVLRSRLRFIPALAGNAALKTGEFGCISVHPRAGGERHEYFLRGHLASGSSPRWRGTQDLRLAVFGLLRFIPALAGNATASTATASSSSVHPRAGGERVPTSALVCPLVGSSPRWRGTQGRGQTRARVLRFIPALAGNAPPVSGPMPLGSVHPRAGGERSSAASTARVFGGSSPRWRGTLERLAVHLDDDRFIPALAGNARRTGFSSGQSPVHPRAGGERLDIVRFFGTESGSSPRWRGTPVSAPNSGPCPRFIPALAGNATTRRRRSATAPVHPRAGGERALRHLFGYLGVGSSPRWRGTLPPPRPARRRSAVHPRAGGERFYHFLTAPWPSGSSPRWRGTPDISRRDPRRHRFIPALAGNAKYTCPCVFLFTVHSRAGGERATSAPPMDSSIGSSPRWRGTRYGCRKRLVDARFIPALAGNARAPGLPSGPSTVHPRAGGERVGRGRMPSSHIGSSPRWRGTLHGGRRDRPTRRFIPALAGNAPPGGPEPQRGTVHPRAGGEREVPLHQIEDGTGSSPRWRGTRPGKLRRVARLRFIPALAGNAIVQGPGAAITAVHPRAGGERLLQHQFGNLVRGSSPRWRGTRVASAALVTVSRFIPALAGNATVPRSTSRSSSVHPRAGGERFCPRLWAGGSTGSSPRWRGTRVSGMSVIGGLRFIPALAGNASPESPASAHPTVHPRAGGERPAGPAHIRRIDGSSPRWRGTLRRIDAPEPSNRFIPALAGNAGKPGGYGRGRAVHPRAGGERPPPANWRMRLGGSSPRWRGTLIRLALYIERDRFIPALAGNASASLSGPAHAAVHPRAGGERGFGTESPPTVDGSSPRWRGTLRATLGGGAGFRFIPALAGNATASMAVIWRFAVHPRAGGERSFWKSLISLAFYDVKQRTGKLSIFGRVP